MRRSLLIALALAALSACGGETTSSDAAVDAGLCRADEACSDALSCNGMELCRPSDPGADARGCVAGESACPGRGCEEAPLRCVTDCATGGDFDGDGATAIACGGEDCSDGDPSVSPSALEVCDAAGVDEDCDPETIGGRDSDGDGYTDAACCNGARCGDDCDDDVEGVHPGEAEECDAIDQDCDAAIDEGALTRFVRDADGDGYGSADPEAEARQACSAPSGFVRTATDCDDGVASIQPGAFDRCDAAEVDDDCSGVPNDPPGGCACAAGASRACPLLGECAAGAQLCIEDRWSECTIAPRLETCGDELDEDCDGAVDEGCPCAASVRACGTDLGECVRGMQRCTEVGWGACEDAIGASDETCDGDDDDCDGMIDEGLTILCYLDEDRDGFAWPAAVGEDRCGACPAGTTARAPATEADCDDRDDRVFPGQTAFFSWRRTDFTYDFDCDGEVIAQSPGTTCATSATGGCVSAQRWTSDVARCGQDIEKGDCAVVGPVGGTFCVEISTCMPFSPGVCGEPLACR